MAVKRGTVSLAVVLAALTFALPGCGIGDDEPAEEPDRAPAEEAATRSRERVQAYLDAMVAKDVAAGRSQFCATAHAAFDAAATSPNGDFAAHFTVPEATVTDVRPGSRGQEVSTSVTVSVGGRSTTRALLFTVTRSGADWCIAEEAPGDPSAPGSPSEGASPAPTPTAAP
ncbi:outer membrane protein assembly factor BamD [Micromonospora sagamiensis]|uniref:Lipoprotein n=1 Tax=Micromonospora sagamiensis TaxID=47875 RepID=A0A562WDA9_9ACTN|nr:hypothetical protein [Micromonospora sagamiensis]TWJ28105.1 hypothetical protein JD81_01608 [Micromonospora sagamiensis]